jgi:hypothetical protein
MIGDETVRNPHSGMPFTASDAEIAAALEDVSIPALRGCASMPTLDKVGVR